MYAKDYEKSIANGIQHDLSFISPEWQDGDKKAISNIESGTGSRWGSLASVRRAAQARSMLAAFQSRDLQNLKQWAYVSAKLDIMMEHERPQTLDLQSMFWAVISDHPEIVGWWKQHALFAQDTKNSSAVDDIMSAAFARLQAWRAFTGDFGELASACKHALASTEALKGVKPRINQFRFYLELAEGNVDGMRQVLIDMCAPAHRRRSFEYESGLTNHFIVMFATLFAKLAWRHAYEVDANTPWIPKDWLPIQPNDSYKDPWPFMQHFDMWQPFAEPYAAYSPQCP